MKAILSRLFNHEELTSEEAKTLLLNITQGQYNDTQIAALLTVFQMLGIKVDELIGFREALLATRVPIDLSAYRPIDIVGTGGDGKNTFNISTCTCFVVAGAGYKVAKHGNYGATSVSGASNVMEQHGVKFTNDQFCYIHCFCRCRCCTHCEHCCSHYKAKDSFLHFSVLLL